MIVPAPLTGDPVEVEARAALAPVDRASRVKAHFATPLYRNAYALVLNTGITSLLGIGYWALAARHYPAAEVGRASAAISAMLLVSGFAQFNLQSAFPRLIPDAGVAVRRLILSGYVLTALAALIAGLGFVLGSAVFGWGGRFLAGTWLVSAWFVLAVVTWTIFTLQDSVLAGLRQAVWVPLENASFSIGKVLLLLALAASAQRFGLFASWTIPVAIVLTPVNWLIFARLIPRHVANAPIRPPTISRRALLSYVAGEYAGGLCSTAALTVLPLIVASDLGLVANGYFYTAWVVGTSFDLVLNQIGTSLTVEGASDEAAFASIARRGARFGLCVVVPGVAACVLAAPSLLGLLGSKYAAHSTTLLRTIALAVLPRSVTVLFVTMARIRRRARTIALVQGSLCALVLLGGVIGLRWWGLDGVGYGYAAAQVVVAAALAPRVIAALRPAAAQRGDQP